MKKVSKIVSGVAELPEHYRPRQHSAVWLSPPPQWNEKLTEVVEQWSGKSVPAIFFRADDIGAGGRAFEALCRLFRCHHVPLAMAVVPAWLSATRSEQLFESAPLDEPLWGWHQHGWRHVNWQRTGKRSEFGEQRPLEKQWRDVWQGQQKMQEIFGNRFLPIFTPPWNRFSVPTLKILQQLDFKGISTAGPLPRGLRSPVMLRNLRIQVDLHTRKEKDPQVDYASLLSELSQLTGKKDPAGIMIHHQRMTPFAFEFLHTLLCRLKDNPGVRILSFDELIQNKDNE